MKHKIKKFVAITVCFALVMTAFSFNIIADSQIIIKDDEIVNLTDYMEVESVINRYRTEEINFTIENAIPLYNFNNFPAFTLYELAPYGYAILLNLDHSMMEACYSDSEIGTALMNTTETIYYGGPNNYLMQNGEDYYHLISGKLISASNVAVISNQMNTIVTNRELLLQQAAANVLPNVFVDPNPPINFGETVTESVAYSYFSTLTEYGLNEYETCTVIALCMLLGYYDYYVNDDYVMNSHENGKGTNNDFHYVLNNYIFGADGPGRIFIRNTKEAINEYLNDMGFHTELNSNYSAQPAVTNTIINKLTEGHPVIGSLIWTNDEGKLSNHSVLIYKVVYDSTDPANSAVVTVNMGWQNLNTAAYVWNAAFFYECGYLVNTNHQFSDWIDTGNFHTRTCTSCTESQQEAHSMLPQNGITYCPYCGKTGDGEIGLQCIVECRH